MAKSRLVQVFQDNCSSVRPETGQRRAEERPCKGSGASRRDVTLTRYLICATRFRRGPGRVRATGAMMRLVCYERKGYLPFAAGKLKSFNIKIKSDAYLSEGQRHSKTIFANGPVENLQPWFVSLLAYKHSYLLATIVNVLLELETKTLSQII